MHRLGWVACSVLVVSGCKGITLDLGQTHTSAAVPLSVIVSRGQDPTLGVDGVFVEAMSTSLQPAPWQFNFFALHPEAGQYLGDLHPQHVHVQALDEALPWQSQGMGAADWDAGMLNTMMTSILQVDGDPLFQIMVPPAVGDFGGTPPDPAKVALFATYCGYLVQYFNLGYFYYPDATGTKIENPKGPEPIRWWAILGDWDTTYGLSGDQYAGIYDKAVEAMLAANADSGVPLSFSSFEYGNLVGNTLYDQHLETFLSSVSTQVDVVSLHMFLTGDRTQSDQEALNSVRTFTSDLDDTFARLGDAGPKASDAQVWVTESNVNSLAPNGSGFMNDLRGTDAFFAAYRPYVFSQLGKHKNRVLYHWDFTAGNIEGGANPDTDPQNAEVDYTTGNRLISYWVDYWLAKLFPVTTLPAGATLSILPLGTPSDAGVVPLDPVALEDHVEVLAVQNSTTGSVVVMMVDIAPDGVDQEGGSTDFDGHGEPRSFVVDVSQLGSFASGLIRVISDPSVDNGPSAPTTPVDFSNESAISVTLPGYGVAFLTLETTSGDGGPSDGGT